MMSSWREGDRSGESSAIFPVRSSARASTLGDGNQETSITCPEDPLLQRGIDWISRQKPQGI